MSNRIYDAFDSIHARQELKKKTEKYLTQRFHSRHAGPVRYVLAAVVLLLILLGGEGYAFYMTPVAAISIDINPSMEWEVNRLDRVISVVCYNEAAERVVEQLRFKHRKYDEAITELLASKEMSGYLSKDSTINFSVASEDAERCAKMQAFAVKCAGHYCKNVSCHEGSTEEWQEANAAGVSLGKYQAFLILQEADPSVTLEEVSGMRMCEIRRLIGEYHAGETENGEIDMTDVCGKGSCSRNEDGTHHGCGGFGQYHEHHHEE